jgi:hypothetical protein
LFSFLSFSLLSSFFRLCFFLLCSHNIHRAIRLHMHCTLCILKQTGAM